MRCRLNGMEWRLNIYNSISQDALIRRNKATAIVNERWNSHSNIRYDKIDDF